MRSPAAKFSLVEAMTLELSAALNELDGDELTTSAAHRCRVLLKRARALARVGELSAPGLASVFDTTARGAMQDLAPMRNLAALSDLARLLASTARPKANAALLATADALDAERAALPSVNTPELHSAIRDLLALAKVWPAPSWRQIRLAAKRVDKRARRARRMSVGAEDPSLRHKWRRREKTRLYAAIALGPAWPGRRRRKRGEAFGRLLGREHDATLLIQRLEQAPGLAGGVDESKRACRILAAFRARVRRRADKLARRS